MDLRSHRFRLPQTLGGVHDFPEFFWPPRIRIVIGVCDKLVMAGLGPHGIFCGNFKGRQAQLAVYMAKNRRVIDRRGGRQCAFDGIADPLGNLLPLREAPPPAHFFLFALINQKVW